MDFCYFNLIDFPIFNVADCYVVIGCILFGILILFYYKDQEFDWVLQKKGSRYRVHHAFDDVAGKW